MVYPLLLALTLCLLLLLSLYPICLLVPSLKHKLMSRSQVTKQLNCCVLMYPKFCLIQDILPKDIIGHGTKRMFYISLMMSVRVMSTWFKGQLITRKDKCGCGIVVWVIRFSIICNMCYPIYLLGVLLLILSVILAF